MNYLQTDYNQTPSPFSAYANSEILRPVKKQDLFAFTHGGEGARRFPGHKVTVADWGDGRPGKPLGVVSERFEVVQMRDLVEQAEDCLQEILSPSQLSTIKVTDKSARGGAFVQRNYEVTGLAGDLLYSGHSLEAGTTLACMLRLRTGYDGKTSTSVDTGFKDLVWDNGLVMFKTDKVNEARHTRISGHISVFRQWVEDAVQSFENRVQEMQTYAGRDMSFGEMEDIVEKLPGVSEKKRKALLERALVEAETRGWNLYTLVSAFTYYSSHNSELFPVRKTTLGDGGQVDNVATTLFDREREVSSWLSSPAFTDLVAA